jgi:hypothetical protein
VRTGGPPEPAAPILAASPSATPSGLATRTSSAPTVDNDGIFVGQRLPRAGSRERKLLAGLLAHGGTRVVSPQGPDTDLEQIFARGELFEGEPSHLKRLRAIRCHSNSADLWESGQQPDIRPLYLAGCELMTGYALSPDGYWRQHSWCVSRAGRPIETTVRRERYFGYRLSAEEAFAFANANQ